MPAGPADRMAPREDLPFRAVLSMLLFVGGLILLVAGADLLVRGATRVAATLGISPLVVGLTVVAFGTSAPELAVSLAASLAGDPDLAVGNAVGSNIFNVLLILGLSAVVAPLVVSRELITRQVPVMIVISAGLWGLSLDGRLGRLEGAGLFGGSLVYTALLIVRGRRSPPESAVLTESPPSAADGPEGSAARPVPRNAGLVSIASIVAGLALLVIGSGWLVEAARSMALALGISDLVVGLTIVSVGTSLPELATSVVASLRGERDIAVGNIVGSNIFNVLAILGASSLVAPAGLAVAPAALTFDLPVMVAVAIACLPIFLDGRIRRWEGGVFLGYYVAYVAYLVLDSTGHQALPEFRAALLGFVLPITAFTLATSVFIHVLRVGSKPNRER